MQEKIAQNNSVKNEENRGKNAESRVKIIGLKGRKNVLKNNSVKNAEQVC